MAQICAAVSLTSEVIGSGVPLLSVAGAGVNKQHSLVRTNSQMCTRAQIKDSVGVTSISMLEPYILFVTSSGFLICARVILRLWLIFAMITPTHTITGEY